MHLVTFTALQSYYQWISPYHLQGQSSSRLRSLSYLQTRISCYSNHINHYTIYEYEWLLECHDISLLESLHQNIHKKYHHRISLRDSWNYTKHINSSITWFHIKFLIPNNNSFVFLPTNWYPWWSITTNIYFHTYSYLLANISLYTCLFVHKSISHS